MLEIKNFSKSYKGGKLAVDNLSLTVNAGEIFGFIGHNGAGKTTTLRSVVGVLDFQEGDILIDGVSIKKEPERCKSVTAYIPDNPDIYDHLTGIQYINFIADIYKVPVKEKEDRIHLYSEAFELTKHLGDMVSSYSHGMKQKLVIISALIHKPKLLVLDEPFVGLDPKASHTLKSIMSELCREGSAIFFSTHVLEVAEKLCTRIGIIKEGKLVLTGTTEEVKGNTSLEDVFLDLIRE